MLPAQSAQERRSQRLDRIYQKLDDAVDVVQSEDPPLALRILDWMQRYTNTGSVDLIDHLESELTAIETNYEMHRAGGDGDAAFPERCEGCPHYGVACPVFTHPVYVTERERLKRELASARELDTKLKYRQLAGRTNCKVITEEIDTWESEYKGLLAEGMQLRAAVVHLTSPKDLAELSQDRLEHVDLDLDLDVDDDPPAGEPPVEADGGTDTGPDTDSPTTTDS